MLTKTRACHPTLKIDGDEALVAGLLGGDRAHVFGATKKYIFRRASPCSIYIYINRHEKKVDHLLGGDSVIVYIK
jgi:hypothetical protein